MLTRLIAIFILLPGPIALACGESEEGILPDLPAGVEAISLMGDTLRAMPAPPTVQRQREEALREARAAFDRNPEDAGSIIWLGRRLAYLGRYREAVRTYTAGIELHPDDARLYRHRGHRFITLRLLDRAVADLTEATRLVMGQADEVEPDGQPNRLGIPLSTLQFNIWYHLGLAHYLRGDFERAVSAYRQCLEVSDNPDLLVATSYWLYMALRRLGREGEADEILRPIDAAMDIVENDSYHKLLLLNKGTISADSLLAAMGSAGGLENATLGYGIGNWHLYNGRSVEAKQTFRRILRGSQWAAFGYIAAEAELARVQI
ncbi:MAG: tetratricopeptide repeat protein [Gemmatimonadales bacterium]